VAVPGGISLLGVWLRFYWTARYHGQGADLHEAFLTLDPPQRAQLAGANLRGANPCGACMRDPGITMATLKDARRDGANLKR